MIRLGRWRAPALALLVALVAACTVQPQRPVSPAPPVAPSPPPEIPPPAATAPVPETEASESQPSLEVISPWPRIRARLAMKGCEYRPQVKRWAKHYTASPRRFAASLERALPLVVVVVDELERRDLPGEFAMLPYVESSYQPVAAQGDRPAGMWQFDGDTARAQGLVVTADYDGRLDIAASTGAALALIERYEKEFGDWRLADMAFNSGEYRVKNLLKGRDARTLGAAQLGKLAFNPITHDHLDRLLALSCIVADPDRFGVELPDLDPGQRLKSITLQSGMDVRLAARLAGVEPAEMKRLNAAYRRYRMVSGVPNTIVMPSANVERFRTAAQSIPVALWNDWREQKAARTSGLASWAAEVGIPVAVLAAANAIGESETIGPTTRLLLPGHEPDVPEKAAPAATYVVKPGDTPSAIAYRAGISLAELKRLNPRLDAKRLKPGQRLRVAGAD